MPKSNIVNIPVKMERFYGKGKMLHPSIDDVEALLKMVPKGKITTIEALAKRLAQNFGTDVTCPMRTGNAIKRISDRYVDESFDEQIPFWRVIRSNQQLIKSKNYERSAAQIETEGFELTYLKSKEVKVSYSEDQLFLFEIALG